ncbi:MAG: hypothetical protein HN348_09940 [Proteobacteria bacterium]|nr:hypothetical protein [Pseudomonadota bacterium]
MIRPFSLAACLAVFPLSAWAQVLEERTDSKLDEGQEKKLETEIFFETEWHEFNNLDFRTLDESSDQAILDSDDRNSLAYTGIGLQVGYKFDEQTRFVFGASHQGLWGNDQLGTTSPFGGFVYVNSAFVEFQPKGNYSPVFRLGRQGYNLGGVPSSVEYVFSDIVDQLHVSLPIPKVGSVELIPVSITSLAAQDDANFMAFVGQAQTETFGFRGDRLTRRHGLQFIADEIPGPVDLQVYGFYTDIGALGSGSDITYEGLLGNFTDNDWVANFGLRAWADFGPVKPWLSIDASAGVDRKELVANDVDATGYAGSVGAEFETGDEDHGLRAQVAYFQALGPAYADDGLQFSHGFVGMKGRHAGGTIASRYLGWHPSSYVGTYGVNHTPHEPARKSGTRVVEAEVGYDFGPAEVKAGWWFFQDTGVTELDLDDLDTLTPPFGYAREEYAAEERMGKVLGQEIDLDVSFDISKHISFYASGAIFLVGPYYKIETARVAGDAMGSTDPAMPWGAYAGAQVSF